jgi:hypothetical protein
VLGPSFGEFKTDEESILERLSRTTRASTGIKSAVVDYGNPSTWHGAKATVAIACKSDAEVKNGMLEALPQCHFIFGRFMELSENLGCKSGQRMVVLCVDRSLILIIKGQPPRLKHQHLLYQPS